MIPTLFDEPPAGEAWVHEIKHDGYRTILVVDDGRVRAWSRRGRDWTAEYAGIVAAAAALPCRRAVLDGEVMIQDERGVSDFGRLRSAIMSGRGVGLVYY